MAGTAGLRAVAALLCVVAAAGGAAAATHPARRPVPPPTWAPAATAAVHPGVMTYTGVDQLQCTANFVFLDGTGAVYLGQAAHCSSTSGSTATNGCQAESRPLGTQVDIPSASTSGRLAYNSWLTMRSVKETDVNTCAFNDLALIRLTAADVARTNPSIPVMGGPQGINTDGLLSLDSVFTYGNSGWRGGLSTLRPKRGINILDQGNSWDHTVYTATPGIPGDSGSAFLDGSGRALGVLSTVALAPYPLSNGVGDLSREIAYARTHGLPGLTLAMGTEPFTGAVF